MQADEVVTNRQRIARVLVLSFLVVIVLLVVSGIVWVKLRPTTYHPLVVETNTKQEVPEYPDPVRLITSTSSEPAQSHVLDGDFRMVNRMQEIPETCISPFDSSFVRSNGGGPATGKIDFADPGQEFQFSDAIMPGLAFRQLAFAGLGSDSCFIYYQRGGPMHPTYCLAVMEYGKTRTTWVGEKREKAINLKALRRMLSRGQFDTSGKPNC